MAATIERAMFAEQFGFSADCMVSQFDGYEPQSFWSLLVNHDANLPVGSVRHMVGPSRNFRIVADFEEYFELDWFESLEAAGFDENTTFVETSTFQVLPEWRLVDRYWAIKLAAAMHAHVAEDVGAVGTVQVLRVELKRLFQSWGCTFLPLAPSIDIGGNRVEASVMLTTDNLKFVNVKDPDFAALIRQRSEQGRGGTRLEPIDLIHGPKALQLHNRLMQGHALSA